MPRDWYSLDYCDSIGERESRGCTLPDEPPTPEQEAAAKAWVEEHNRKKAAEEAERLANVDPDEITF